MSGNVSEELPILSPKNSGDLIRANAMEFLYLSIHSAATRSGPHSRMRASSTLLKIGFNIRDHRVRLDTVGREALDKHFGCGRNVRAVRTSTKAAIFENDEVIGRFQCNARPRKISRF